MIKLKELISTNRIAYKILAFLILGILGMTGLLYYTKSSYFSRFLGEMNPLVSLLICGILSIILLSWLQFNGWFFIFEKGKLRRSLSHSWWVLLFASIAILVGLGQCLSQGYQYSLARISDVLSRNGIFS